MTNTATDRRHVRVGVGVIVCRHDRVLIGKRAGSHGANTWSFPGGHVEFGEDPTITARREVFEETGLHIVQPEPFAFTSDFFEQEGLHYITLFYIADAPNEEPRIRESDKCLEWRWADYTQLPEPLFLPILSLKKLHPAWPLHA